MSGFSLNLVLQDNRVSIRWHMTKLLKEYIINKKILKVYNDEKNKGILKSLLQFNGYIKLMNSRKKHLVAILRSFP